MSCEVVLGTAVSMCFPVEIAVFDIQAEREPDLCLGRQLFAARLGGARPSEMEDCGISTRDHFGPYLNLDRPAVARVGHKVPNSRGAGFDPGHAAKIER
jgi:hypothetical protein